MLKRISQAANGWGFGSARRVSCGLVIELGPELGLAPGCGGAGIGAGRALGPGLQTGFGAGSEIGCGLVIESGLESSCGQALEPSCGWAAELAPGAEAL